MCYNIISISSGIFVTDTSHYVELRRNQVQHICDLLFNYNAACYVFCGFDNDDLTAELHIVYHFFQFPFYAFEQKLFPYNIAACCDNITYCCWSISNSNRSICFISVRTLAISRFSFRKYILFVFIKLKIQHLVLFIILT